MQVRNRAKRLTDTTGLDDPRFRPLLGSLARISILVEQSFESLKQRKSLLDAKGELCSSIDTVRRLLDSQVAMLRLCGLTPTAVLPPDSREYEAVFDRINKMKSVRAATDSERDGKITNNNDSA
jgi:hypothetical protein